MEEIKLKSKKRKELGSKALFGFKQGMIPAVLYGKGVKNENLWINGMELKKLLRKSGESVIIKLETEEGKNRNVLINEIQKDPIREDFIHIDFYQVKMDEKIETEVELVFVGQSRAVKESAGVLVKNLDEIRVKCFPKDLPSQIDVDISQLKTFEDHILVKDLKISSGIEVKADPETVIALVAPPRSEEELKELEGKVEEDVTKVEGVLKEETELTQENSEEKEEKKEG
jgi:large subunit ribosomal protein L25